MTRGRLAPALALLAATVAAAPAAPAAEGPARPSARAPRAGASTGADEKLEALWFTRRSAVEVGDAAAAAGRIEEMLRLLEAERLDRVTWLARGFAYEGYEHLREGNYERAREAFDNARRFDPRLAEAQTGYAWAALRAGRGLGTFLGEYRKALALRWQTFLREERANVYWLLLAASWFAAVAVVAVLLFRYHAMLRHDVAEAMPRRWPEGASRLAGWVVLLAPLLCWFGGAWLVLYWCVVLARYMTGSERVLAALVCLAVVATGPLAARGLATSEIASDPTVLAVEEALQGGYGAGVIASLKRAVAQSPDVAVLRLLLAITYERAGLKREAFEQYQAILQVRPDEPRVLNNLANLHAQAGQTPQAIIFYGRAVEADPRRAVYYHNLFLAQSEANRFADAEASLRRIQELDPELARALVASRDRAEEARPLMATVSADEVRRELAESLHPGAASLADALRAPTGVGALGALVLLGWSSLGRSSTRAQTCLRCGEAFCGRCKKELGAKECCAQCIHLFIKKDSIAPDVKARKLAQVDRSARLFRTRVRALSLLLPGAGHLFAGRTLSGAAILLAWIVPLTALVLKRRLLLPPALPVLDLPALTTLLATAFLAILWATANLFAPRLPS
jgi:Tfp pilus assembly protein PilF